MKAQASSVPRESTKKFLYENSRYMPDTNRTQIDRVLPRIGEAGPDATQEARQAVTLMEIEGMARDIGATRRQACCR